MRRDLQNSHHLATISHDGRFWDAYLELVEAQGPGQPTRGRIAFSAADAGDAEPVRTTTIFIEDTPQEVVVRARDFKTHQLVALLRSATPPDPDTADAESVASPGSEGTAQPDAEEGSGPSSGPPGSQDVAARPADPPPDQGEPDAEL